jgi:hypothetical protein
VFLFLLGGKMMGNLGKTMGKRLENIRNTS